VHVLRLWAAVGKISVADGQDTIGREETWPTSDPVYPQMSHRIDYIQIGPKRQTEKNHGKLSNTNIFFVFWG